MDHVLQCQRCERTFDPGLFPRGCPDCRSDGEAGRLEAVVDLATVDASALPFGTDRSHRSDMWRYRELLPLRAAEPVTMGEGWTPLVELPDAGGDATVLLKNETGNPTWSFKDRLNSLLLSNAVAGEGRTHVATSSTGNHGASTAAYARLAGAEEVLVLIPPETERPIRAQIRAYGAKAAVTDYEERRPLLRSLAKRGWYPTVSVSKEYVSQPYGNEAYKTIAFELVEALETPPDVVVAAVGSGDGLYGTWKGFRELRDLGVIDRTPRMVGVQPAERPSLVTAVEEGHDTVGEAPGPMPSSVSASGDSAGDHALRAIRESDGTAYGIDEAAVQAAMRAAALAGVVPEPASALAPAAVDRAVGDGVVGPGDTVVCVATGAGVKWPDALTDVVGQPPRVEPRLDALAETLGVSVDAPTQ
ncbi:threonine synthase [Halopenitus persicus]|uniref:threonine synthase n=1 Tax=Halopenitus persicus TaxID=1048396 RepID=UPI000BBA65E3|nr:pyridoxal-phosphate dependent enzyme [Halopenitus persicus]